MGKDQIPPKLIKIAGEFLVEILSNIINCCPDTSTFHDLGKRASVIPVDNGSTDKHTSTNYRLVW